MKYLQQQIAEGFTKISFKNSGILKSFVQIVLFIVLYTTSSLWENGSAYLCTHKVRVSYWFAKILF